MISPLAFGVATAAGAAYGYVTDRGRTKNQDRGDASYELPIGAGALVASAVAAHFHAPTWVSWGGAAVGAWFLGEGAMNLAQFALYPHLSTPPAERRAPGAPDSGATA